MENSPEGEGHVSTFYSNSFTLAGNLRMHMCKRVPQKKHPVSLCIRHVTVQNWMWTDAESPLIPGMWAGDRSPSKALCCPGENNHDNKGKWKVWKVVSPESVLEDVELLKGRKCFSTLSPRFGPEVLENGEQIGFIIFCLNPKWCIMHQCQRPVYLVVSTITCSQSILLDLPWEFWERVVLCYGGNLSGQAEF